MNSLRLEVKGKIVRVYVWKWWEVPQGSERVHYFGNKFGEEKCTVSSLVM
jgi:hypothetical protein